MFDRVIDAVERRLATDVRYLIHGISWLTFGQVVSSGATFILALAFANLLPQETYGTYRYVLSVAAILAIPALNGINNAVVQSIASRKEGTVLIGFSEKLRYGLIGSLGALVGSAYYFINDNAILSACFAIVALMLPLMEAFGLFDSIFQGRQDFKRSTIVDSVLQVVAAGGIIVFVVTTKSIIAIIAAYFVVWTLGRALAWWYVHTYLPLKNKEVDPRTIPFGKHLSLMSAGGVVAQYADQVLLFQHIGATELAIYAIALAIPEQFKNSFRGIFSLLLPRYSQHSTQAIRATIWHKAGTLAFIALLMTIGYILIIPWALPFFFPKYEASVFYSQLIAVTFVTSVSGIFTTALQALHKTRELYMYNALFPVIQIILVFTGVLWLGILGAVLARVATRFIMCATAIFLYYRSQ